MKNQRIGGKHLFGHKCLQLAQLAGSDPDPDPLIRILHANPSESITEHCFPVRMEIYIF
jgi:hypothetical protein